MQVALQGQRTHVHCKICTNVSRRRFAVAHGCAVDRVLCPFSHSHFELTQTKILSRSNHLYKLRKKLAQTQKMSRCR